MDIVTQAKLNRSLAVGAIVALLLFFVLGTLALTAPRTPDATGSVGFDLRHPPSKARQEAHAPGSEHVDIVKTVVTNLDADRSVFNGARITYSIAVTNQGTTDVTDVQLLDVLPEDALEEVRCIEPCGRVIETEKILAPTGGQIEVSSTTQISWTVLSLAPGQSLRRTFSGLVTGQSEGTTLRNQALVTYDQGGDVVSVPSNRTETTVRLRVERRGRPSVTSAPTWLSKDLGGTISQDWGDFDRDGDLDLVLGSSTGTTVYRNVDGQLERFWGNDRLTYGVQWADFDADGYLEFVAVGESEDDTPSTMGTNYLYERQGNAFVGETFTSTVQIVRVQAGDFDGDGSIDIVAGTNRINPNCPVRLYRNMNGSFHFDESLCISTRATAAISGGDFDNDGDPDLVLGRFPNEVVLLINDGGVLTETNSIPIDTSIRFLPYEFAWGDYDGDGYLDLAAGYPLHSEVRIYRNDGGTGFSSPPTVCRTAAFLTPLSLDWGTFDGSSRLDLIAGDTPPRTLRQTGGSSCSSDLQLSSASLRGQLWNIRTIDQDGDGDLDVAISNRDRPSLLFSTFGAFLDSSVTALPSTAPASSVAWGDADGNGLLDLLVGAGPAASGQFSTLFYNDRGVFSADNKRTYTGFFGPHSVAFGDVDRDGALDVALATGVNDANHVFLAGNSSTPAWSSEAPHLPSHSAAWGDADADGDLDLLIGNDGANRLYLNRKRDEGRTTTLLLDGTPIWTSPATDDTRSVAWGNYDYHSSVDIQGKDIYMDFAVGNADGPTRVYRNNGDTTFGVVWSSTYVSDTRAVAWGDYDGDGDLDLAVGNYGAANVLYENQIVSPTTTSASRFVKVWESEEISKTTSLAWGDWNNDGHLDLAVGNDGEPDQIYANLNSAPGTPQLFWLWSSTESQATSAVAWGDYDGDGDLDLAVSQTGDGTNGFYLNNYVRPSHLQSRPRETLRLPQQPTYAAIERPGNTSAAYAYSSGDFAASPFRPTVTVTYRLFDPDGARASTDRDPSGDAVHATFFEYSLTGGTTWQQATPAASSPTPITRTSLLGREGTFVWDAQSDQAISDDARFRVRLVQQDALGPVKWAATTAVSPPFRVRGLSCVWPSGPGIIAAWESQPQRPDPGEAITFVGTLAEGSGQLEFRWNFGDGSPSVSGQTVEHEYGYDGTYQLTLSVHGQPCPLTRPVTATKTMTIGTGTTPEVVYLPLVLTNDESAAVAPGTKPRSAPEQVTGLTGRTTPADDVTILQWQPATGGVGYHVYRGSVDEPGSVTRIATLPPGLTRYVDLHSRCGTMYHVTTFTLTDEAPVSTTSYMTLPCRQ